MRPWIYLLAVALAYEHSESDIEDVCSFQDAEATSPQLSPGESVTRRLHSVLGSNYLSHYFNANDTHLTSSELQHYLVDIWPSWMFLFLCLLTLIVWMSYCFCVAMKCCYCVIGPATKSVGKGKRRTPYIAGLVFGVVCLALVPVTIYYATQLYRNLLYLRCAALRYSGGYYYGYKTWVGLTALNTSGEYLISQLLQDTASANATLFPFYSDSSYYIDTEPQKMLKTLDDRTLKWENTPLTANPSAALNAALPQTYKCAGCTALRRYYTDFQSELNVFIRPFTAKCIDTLQSTYRDLINPLDDIVSAFRERLAALGNVTVYMEEYDSGNLKRIETNVSVSMAMYFLVLGVGCMSMVIMSLTVFSVLCVGMERYKWRAGLHASWCVHSFFMSLLLACAGLLLPFTVLIAEGCGTMRDILNNTEIANLVVLVIQGGEAGRALESCFTGNKTFDSYLNATEILSFLGELKAKYAEIVGYKFDGNTFQYASVTRLKQEIESLKTSTFVSTADSAWQWNATSDITFFLTRGTYRAQQSTRHSAFFLNDYTDYNTGSGQLSYCRSKITNDFWVYKQESCPADYTYLPKMLLILSSTAAPTCYALSGNFTQADLNSRYVNLNMYAPCNDVGTRHYADAVLDYWGAANQSYTLELTFRNTLQSILTDETALEVQFRSSLQKIESYESALGTASQYIEAMYALIEPYAVNLNCSSLDTLTVNLYQSFCGELIPNSFMITLAAGALGMALLGLTVSVMMAYFWFRSILEIDREQVMRNVGKPQHSAAPIFSEKADSTVEASSERTILEVEAPAPPSNPNLEVFRITKPPPKVKSASSTVR